MMNGACGAAYGECIWRDMGAGVASQRGCPHRGVDRRTKWKVNEKVVRWRKPVRRFSW